MKLTEEVLKARAERKARRDELAQAYEARMEAAKAEAKAENRKLLKQIKVKYPAQFAEFKKLKKLKVKYNTGKYDDQLHWLQMEMLGKRSKWIWFPLQSNMSEYDAAENKIIWTVAGKYYKSLEDRLWAGEKVGHPILDDFYRDELILLIEKAGIDTFERVDGIEFYSLEDCLDKDTRLSCFLLPWEECYIQYDCPDELKF